MDTCKNCGKPLREGVKFCPGCGHPVLHPPLSQEEYVTEAAAAIDDALERKLSESTVWREEAPSAAPVREEPEPVSAPEASEQTASQPWDAYGREEDLETVEGEIVEEKDLPNRRPRGAAPQKETESPPAPLPPRPHRSRRKGGTLKPQARKALIIALLALAAVLIFVLVLLLTKDGREGQAKPVSGPVSSQGAENSASQSQENPPAAQIPGPQEPSSLKTTVAQAIEPQFLEADQFQENGLARVRTANGWEVIDQYGKFISAQAYEEIGYYSDGYCWVKKDGRYAFMGEDGTILGDDWYRSLLPFSEGLALVETDTGRYVYIDVQGDVAVNPVENYKSLGSFSGGLARVVELDGRVAYMDTEGNIAYVSKGRFTDGKTFDPETGLCPVTNDDVMGWYYISSSDGSGLGTVMTGFDSASTFEDGVAIVSRGGKMAHIRSDGSLITDFEYDEVWRFSDGYATVRIGDRYGYVDTSGQLVIPVTLEDVWSFGDGLVPVKLTNDWGYLNGSGEIAIKAQWDECYKFYDGVAKFREEDRYGYLNTQGDLLCPPQYKAGGYCSFGMIPVQTEDGLWGYLAVT